MLIKTERYHYGVMELLIKNLLTEKHPQLINNSFLMQTVPDYGERSKSTPNSLFFYA